jgi:glutamate 5-kinase
MATRNRLWVVKIGSGLLTNKSGQIDTRQISTFASQIHQLRERGIVTVLVSSGAVSAGMTALGEERRPRVRKALQACATIGQTRLMNAYQSAFRRYNLLVGQILLTYWDLDSRKLYENTRATIEHLLKLGNCVPIVNENDALSFEEIEMLNCFGDNDRLSAQVAKMMNAKKLIILSSIEGLYTSMDGDGELIREVREINDRIRSYAGSSSSERSVGGMISKLETAREMMEAGIPTVIANGKHRDVLLKLADRQSVGTLFRPRKK